MLLGALVDTCLMRVASSATRPPRSSQCARGPSAPTIGTTRLTSVSIPGKSLSMRTADNRRRPAAVERRSSAPLGSGTSSRAGRVLGLVGSVALSESASATFGTSIALYVHTSIGRWPTSDCGSASPQHTKSTREAALSDLAAAMSSCSIRVIVFSPHVAPRSVLGASNAPPRASAIASESVCMSISPSARDTRGLVSSDAPSHRIR